MPRGRKKKREITINSNETRIVIGLIIMVLGLATAISPFLSATFLEYVRQFFGYASIPWGITIFFLSLKLIWKSDFTSSNKTLLALVFLSISTTIFISFWISDTYIYSPDDIAGGKIGAFAHFKLAEILSKPIEFLVLIILFAISFSLFTGIKLEQITEFVSGVFGNLSFKSKDSQKIKIEGDDEIEEDDDIEGSEDIKIHMNTSLDDEELEKSPQPTYINTPVSMTAEAPVEDFSGHREPKFINWTFPPISLLQNPQKTKQDRRIHERNAAIIEKTLESFEVHSKVTNISIGPTVVQYALSITIGTKVAKVKNLTNDLALALATSSNTIRIEAPIPGTSFIGIEIPNPTPNFVYEKEMMSEILNSGKKYELPLILGKNVAGKTEIRDLAELPHLLVAGATGTGKSVGINSIIMGLLMTKSPDELKLILVDPKTVEMAPYNDIPHLYTPVISDMELVGNALQWAVQEMTRRYRILKMAKVRKITEYHQKEGASSMPYIVIIIDEMADLMLTVGVNVESKIVKLAQMSRAVGIHLILATQRPTVNIITGLIKANIPGRIAFNVTTAIDSRVILDQMGAETLIGKGDMLFKSPSSPKALRIQGAWTDMKDIENVIDFIKQQTSDVDYLDDITKPAEAAGEQSSGGKGSNSLSRDSMFNDALEVVINAQKGSASLLQRKLKIGYNRAASLIDDLEAAGVIGPQEGSAPRKVLLTSPEQLMGPSHEVEEEID